MGLFRGGQKTGLIEVRNGTFVDGNRQYPFSNCLIAGVKSAGRDALLRSLIIDSINDNKAVFVIQNGNALPRNTIRDEFAVNSGCRNYFSLDFGKQYFTNPVNFFKDARSVDFVKELLFLLMLSYKEMSADSKSFTERYLNEIFELLQYRLPPIKKFTLSGIADFDRIWLKSEAARLLNAGKIDIRKHDKVVDYVDNDLPLYRKELNEYVNFCTEIQKQNFASLLSGDLPYSQLNSSQFITFIIMDSIACAKQSSAFLKLFIHRAIYEMQMAKVDTTFIFEDVDIATVTEFRELLKACGSKQGNNVYFTLDKISSFSSGSFDPRAYCNSFFVFKQAILSEAEEWAKTSGTYRKDKATQTTSTYDQVYGHRNTGFLGGVANLLHGKKQVVTGTNHEIVDEYNVLPSEFMNLDSVTSQVIINDNSGQKYIKQIKWA